MRMIWTSLLLGLSAGAQGQSWNYSDFSSTAGLSLNGATAPAGNALRLVPSSPDLAGSAFADTQVALNPLLGFSTSFSFLVSPDPQSGLGVTDGFAFLLQTVGPEALGAPGQGLGYVGLTDSVAVVFRGRGPSFIGLIAGGVDPAELPEPFNPPDSVPLAEGSFYGSPYHAWIDYTPGVLRVFVSGDAQKPADPLMQTAISLDGLLGPQAWVGFSAGNGGAFSSQDILRWDFSVSAVPEPQAWALMLLGLGAFCLRRQAR
jgi:Legume lectin domain